MSGKSSANLLCTFIAVGINVPLNFILIPRLGATGSAIAWTVSILATNSVQMYMLWRMFHMHALGKELLTITTTCVGIFVGFGWAARFALGTNLASLAVYVTGSIVAYAVVLYRTREMLHVDSFMQIIRGSIA
jgi:O-antigen/teichoic acid export membrane protein